VGALAKFLLFWSYIIRDVPPGLAEKRRVLFGLFHVRRCVFGDIIPAVLSELGALYFGIMGFRLVGGKGLVAFMGGVKRGGLMIGFIGGGICG
jgi:hypothetical protein